MKIKITGIIIMVIFAGTLIFYTCGKSQPQTDNQIYIGVACYDQKDTFIEELVDAFKEQCSSMESKDYAISMTIMDASDVYKRQHRYRFVCWTNGWYGYDSSNHYYASGYKYRYCIWTYL